MFMRLFRIKQESVCIDFVPDLLPVYRWLAECRTIRAMFAPESRCSAMANLRHASMNFADSDANQYLARCAVRDVLTYQAATLPPVLEI